MTARLVRKARSVVAIALEELGTAGARPSASWRKSREPHATAWRLLVRLARSCGLVHAMDVFDDYCALRKPGPTSPADLADLVADVVAAGELVPIKVDFSHPRYGRSLRAFRAFQPGGAIKPSATWCAAEAHLWTYAVPEDAARIAAREASR